MASEQVATILFSVGRSPLPPTAASSSSATPATAPRYTTQGKELATPKQSDLEMEQGVFVWLV